jgi:DNA polymerase III alpha subunit
MAAVLSNRGGFYGPGAYVQEARRMGIRILLPCINRSSYEYTGRTHGVGEYRGEIRMGLMSVKGVGEGMLRSVVAERKARGAYASPEEFFRRTPLGDEQIRVLIRCGALDCFGISRPELLWTLALAKGERGSGNMLLFEGEEETAIRESRLWQSLEDYSTAHCCRIELESFGFTVTRHPLEFFPAALERAVPAREVGRYTGREVRMAGWMIAARRIRTRATGEYMKFLSMEDLTGTFEAVLFPRAYRQYAPSTLGHGPYWIEGTVQSDHGAHVVNAKRIGLLSRSGEKRSVCRR